MIPICLVTGFLGSGKTTYLKRVARATRGRRLVFLVNEFAAVDIDGQLVADDEGLVVSIPGGSIFCKCLVTDFIAQLKRIHDVFNTLEEPVEGVVIEASGMANPKVIEQMLRETRLDSFYRLATIVSVLAPGSFLKLLHTLPNIRAQVEVADVVLLNKVDVHDVGTVDAAEARVRELNARARIVRTVQADVQLELFGAAARTEMVGEYAACRDPNYHARTVPLTSDVDPEWLREALGGVRSSFYRAKGFFRAGGRPYFLDYSEEGLDITEAPGHAGAFVFAFILRANPAPAALLFLAELEQTRPR